MYALPFNFALERDLKNIFYYQHDIKNYTDQVLNFLLFDRHEYIHTVCNSGQYTCITDLCNFFFVLKDSIDRLFPKNSFSEELASFWLLTLYITSFFQ